jgi:choline kinase
MRAIILAAGEGTRLRPHTLDRPKCLVPLAGRSLLARQADALRRAGVSDITVVTGYRADQVAALGFATVFNERFRETNMVASAMCARALFDGSDDAILCYGDLVYESRHIDALANCNAPVAITVDRDWRSLWSLRMVDPLEDAETLRCDDNDHVVEIGRKPSSYDEIEGQYMGLVGVRAGFARQFVEAHDALDPGRRFDTRDRDHMYMTDFLQHLIDHVTPVAAVVVEGGWLEVDTASDLETYESLHDQGGLDRYCVLAED